MFTVTGLIVLIAAVIGSAGMVAVLAWLTFRIRRLEEGGAAGGHDHLLDEVDRLRDEVEAARRQTRALAEQVDFMERLLAAGDEDEGPGARGAGNEEAAGEGGAVP